MKAEAGPARMSKDQLYRYTLHRTWNARNGYLAWMGLNPSTADQDVLDPTMRRILDFSSSWGYGGFVMLNLFAYRATSPRDLRLAPDPVGPHNDVHIEETLINPQVGALVVCWGDHGKYQGRDLEVAEMLVRLSRHVRVYCVGSNVSGQPTHPLYLAKTTMFEPWDARRHMKRRSA